MFVTAVAKKYRRLSRYMRNAIRDLDFWAPSLYMVRIRMRVSNATEAALGRADQGTMVFTKQLEAKGVGGPVVARNWLANAIYGEFYMSMNDKSAERFAGSPLTQHPTVTRSMNVTMSMMGRLFPQIAITRRQNIVPEEAMTRTTPASLRLVATWQ